jgi:hypothetical protein
MKTEERSDRIFDRNSVGKKIPVKNDGKKSQILEQIISFHFMQPVP